MLRKAGTLCLKKLCHTTPRERDLLAMKEMGLKKVVLLLGNF